MTIPARIDPVTAPLTPAAFHILLALVDARLHGLGIADAVEQLTDGDMQLGPGTLYRSLKELAAVGLLREAAAPTAGDDPRRKYYELTDPGREQLELEARRLERIVDAARQRRVLQDEA